MKSHLVSLRLAAAAALATPAVALAVPVTPVDLDSVDLGAMIVGPVGPTVDVSLAADDVSYGDLTSNVSCPAGFTECVPPNNPAGTLYTYQHTVTPGVDEPNDPPFPAPAGSAEFEDITSFSLGFDAAGFTGLAGYDFGDAEAAFGDGGGFGIELEDDGSLTWTVQVADEDAAWDTGESITFFWQTTQPPSGPGGQYAVTGDGITASGNGPVPTPVVVPPTPVTEPGGLALALIGLAGVGVAARRARG